MRFCLVVTCAVLWTLLGAPLAHADKRVALVIGNSAYRFMPRLMNPQHDAEDVDAVQRAGRGGPDDGGPMSPGIGSRS